ncbi:MAG: hypothetical protein KDF64_15605 [Geminicoccaceae bacterium]|nr:hypothetical protein [Geminicoccaceae bacterium]
MIDDILNLAEMPIAELPPLALEKAGLSLLDWMVCGWAGRDEPLAEKLRALAAREAGTEVATLIGGGKAPTRMAAEWPRW